MSIDSENKGDQKMAYELTKRCELLRDEAVDIRAMSEKISPIWAYWTRYGHSLLDPAKEHDNITICAAGIDSVLRNAPAVIVGRNQNTEAEINAEAVQTWSDTSGFDLHNVSWFMFPDGHFELTFKNDEKNYRAHIPEPDSLGYVSIGYYKAAVR